MDKEGCNYSFLLRTFPTGRGEKFKPQEGGEYDDTRIHATFTARNIHRCQPTRANARRKYRYKLQTILV